MTELLYSRTQGCGPHLVLVHGLFGSMENLGAQARLLAEHFTVHSIDLPNHGRSPHSPSMSLQSMADALKYWLDDKGITQALFVGHSLGGKVVMELALQYPSYVDKLAVIDIAPVRYEPRHNDVFAAFEAVNPAEINQRTEADAKMAPFVSEIAVRSFLLKNLTKSDVGFCWRMNLPVIKENYTYLIGANSDAGVFEGAVLFVKGGKSDYLREDYRNAIMSRFPHATLKVVNNTGHWLHAEKPEQVGRLLSRFLLAE